MTVCIFYRSVKSVKSKFEIKGHIDVQNSVHVIIGIIIMMRSLRKITEVTVDKLKAYLDKIHPNSPR